MTTVKCPECYKKWEAPGENAKDRKCPECEKRSGRGGEYGAYRDEDMDEQRREEERRNLSDKKHHNR